MKINKITLCNIGPYNGRNEFSLVTQGLKNIVLIGGKNGTGKTSLLKSIKFGLFGPYSMGYKTESKTYHSVIKELLNLDAKTNEYYIEIEFEIIENLINDTYVIKRYWEIDEEGNLIESLNSKKNGFQLSQKESLNLQEKLKSFTSPDLINCTIFDGEKIANLIENNQISDFIKNTFETIFNINILKQLSKDMISFIEKNSNNAEDSEKIRNLKFMQVNLENEKNEIKFIENNIKNLTNEIKETESKIKTIKKALADLGKLTKNEKRLFEIKLKEKQKQNESFNFELRRFIETNLPIAINLKILKNAITQSQKELPLLYINYIESISNYLSNENYSNKDLDNIKELLYEKTKEVKSLHNLTEESINNIKNKYELIRQEHKEIKKNLRSSEKNVRVIEQFRLALETQEEIEQFENLNKDYSSNEVLLSNLKAQFNSEQKLLNDKKVSFENLFETYTSLYEEYKKNVLLDGANSTALKAMEINDKYIEYLITEKLKEVSSIALKKFNELLYKDNFIKELTINKEYEIELVNTNNVHINIDILSAGETQLLVSSIIWAMYKTSNRNTTFVFDTPLARLDYENRLKFINNIIKTISDRVVVLSTDSEFVEEYFEAISSNVFKLYKLDYNELTKSTIIYENEYFG